MIDDYFDPGASSLNRKKRLSLSDFGRIRDLRILLRNVKRGLSETVKDNATRKDEREHEMAVILAIRREIHKREQTAFESEFGR